MPGRGKGTEGKFPASKVPTLLFRKGWRKETSVYRGSTLPDDVLGALPAFIIPPPDNFTRQGDLTAAAAAAKSLSVFTMLS